MFKTPKKVKSNTQLKSSERKKILSKLTSSYEIKDDDIIRLFPSKETLTCIKLFSDAKDTFSVYVSEGVPLFYDCESRIFPTIFLLWECPYLLPYIKVYSGVVQKLLGGADLMVPGIVTDQENLRQKNYESGELVYINSENNMAAIGVGVTMISTSLMLPPNKKGRAVNLVHVYGDELCKFHESLKAFPTLTFPSNVKQVESKDSGLAESIEAMSVTDSSEKTDDNLNEEKKTEEDMTMDDLLHYSFTKALKKSASKLELPILTNIFYKNYILKYLPHNMSLDLKKTKYKKLSNFLTLMDKSGVIKLEDDKGVQSITAVNYEHELFYNFVDNFKEQEKCEVEVDTQRYLEITEKKVVNGAVDKLFKNLNYRKGDSLTDQEVRQSVKEYIRHANLQDENSKEFVNLNDELCNILQTKDYRIKWKDLFESVYKRMGNSYEIRLPDNQIISGKGKLPPIDITVATKTGNKKVTLVNNLELYGININEFSKECQHGVAASSTINVLPSSKSAQFQIQGNQKKYIDRILREKYFIPKKYIHGVDDPKQKKN